MDAPSLCLSLLCTDLRFSSVALLAKRISLSPLSKTSDFYMFLYDLSCCSVMIRQGFMYFTYTLIKISLVRLQVSDAVEEVESHVPSLVKKVPEVAQSLSDEVH